MGKQTIIFGDRLKPIRPADTKPKNKNQKPRKKRSDALHDIKFRVTKEQKSKLKTLAMEHNKSLTGFLSMIVSAEILADGDLNVYEYDHNGEFVHAMVSGHVFEMIKTLSIEWDQPFRKVAHRFIMDYLFRKNSGVRIIHYQGGEIHGI